MKHLRKLDKHFYKEWCPELTLIERFVFRVDNISTIKLDLHGLKIQEAYEKTIKFIEESHKIKIFEIYIITGASGEIKKEFPHWVTSHKLIKFYELVNSGEFKLWLIKQT